MSTAVLMKQPHCRSISPRKLSEATIMDRPGPALGGHFDRFRSLGRLYAISGFGPARPFTLGPLIALATISDRCAVLFREVSWLPFSVGMFAAVTQSFGRAVQVGRDGRAGRYVLTKPPAVVGPENGLRPVDEALGRVEPVWTRSTLSVAARPGVVSSRRPGVQNLDRSENVFRLGRSRSSRDLPATPA